MKKRVQKRIRELGSKKGEYIDMKENTLSEVGRVAWRKDGLFKVTGKEI